MRGRCHKSKVSTMHVSLSCRRLPRGRIGTIGEQMVEVDVAAAAIIKSVSSDLRRLLARLPTLLSRS